MVGVEDSSQVAVLENARMAALAERIGAVQGEVAELSSAEQSTAAELQSVTDRIRDIASDQPQATMTLKDGLSTLETYVNDVIAAVKIVR